MAIISPNTVCVRLINVIIKIGIFHINNPFEFFIYYKVYQTSFDN